MVERVEIVDAGDGKVSIKIDGVEIAECVRSYEVRRGAGDLHRVTFEVICRRATITDQWDQDN